MNISDYLYRKASINKIPLGGTFELSPVCNFACKMCYVRKTAEQIRCEGKRLKDWKEWIALAKECRKEGTLYLLLTGGEPFLYPHFRELYEELHRMGFLLSINTNGTMINEETVSWLKTMAPTRLNITLYGASEETYQRVCGNPKGFQLVKKAILMLKEAGIPVVINGSMIPENEADMEQILAFGEQLNLNTRVSTYMFPPARREAEEGDSRFSPQKAADIYMRKLRYLTKEDYQKVLKNEIGKLLSKEDLERGQMGNEGDWGHNLEYMRCRAGRSSFWVSWEGNMTACGMLSFPLVKNSFETPFIQCWQEITHAVRTTKVLHECNRCEKKELCNPCVAMLDAETGELNHCAPYLCEMTEGILARMRMDLQECSCEESNGAGKE